MRRLVLLAALALSLVAACGSGPVETWQDALASGQVEPIGFCDAFAVMERKCLRCHSDPPKNGAPFALASYAATQVASPSSREPDRLRADRMLAAVESGFMPYTSLLLDPPVEPLTCEERETLLRWLRDGAPPPARNADCSGTPAPRLLECPSDGEAGASGT